MNDPAIGAMGAVALILVLIAKWAALTSLIDANAAVLLWLPALARTQLLLVFLTIPYAGRGGIGAGLAAKLPRRKAQILVALTWGTCLLTFASVGWVLALAAGTAFVLWRRATLLRLRGFTGDTAGALVELTEVFGLLAVVVVYTW
jgi:adenosylcobinamide-GDP ribazoletransferase